MCERLDSDVKRCRMSGFLFNFSTSYGPIWSRLYVKSEKHIVSKMQYNVGFTGKVAIELIVITCQCVAPGSGYKVHFCEKIIDCGDMNLSSRQPVQTLEKLWLHN